MVVKSQTWPIANSSTTQIRPDMLHISAKFQDD